MSMARDAAVFLVEVKRLLTPAQALGIVCIFVCAIHLFEPKQPQNMTVLVQGGA